MQSKTHDCHVFPHTFPHVVTYSFDDTTLAAGKVTLAKDAWRDALLKHGAKEATQARVPRDGRRPKQRNGTGDGTTCNVSNTWASGGVRWSMSSDLI